MKITKAISQINNRGWWYVMGIVCNRIISQRLFRFRITGVYEFQLDQIQSNSDRDQSFEVTACLDQEEIQQAASLSWYQTPSGDQASASTSVVSSQESSSSKSPPSQTTQAYLGCRDGEPIAAVWLAQNYFIEPELGLSFRLCQKAQWLFAANVDKSARRQGIYRRLLSGVAQLNQSSHFYAAINPTNKASMAAHRNVIAKQLGWYVNIRLLNMAACYGKGEIQQSHRLTFNALEKPIELTLPRVD